MKTTERHHKNQANACILLLVAGMFFAKPVAAQSRGNYHHKVPKTDYSTFNSLYSSIGVLNNNNPPLHVVMDIPYTSSLLGNSTQNLHIDKPGIVPSKLMMLDIFHYDFSYRNFIMGTGIGMFGSTSASRPDMSGNVMFSLNTGYNIPINFGRNDTYAPLFMLQATVAWSINSFGVDLGGINNQNLTLYTLGCLSNPTFTYNNSSSNNNTNNSTATADNLDLKLKENIQFLTPKLTLKASLGRNSCWYVGLSAAYNIAIKQTENIELNAQSYTSNNASNNVGEVNLNNNRMSMYINDVPSNHIPLKLNDFSFSVSIGVNLFSHKK